MKGPFSQLSLLYFFTPFFPGFLICFFPVFSLSLISVITLICVISGSLFIS